MGLIDWIVGKINKSLDDDIKEHRKQIDEFREFVRQKDKELEDWRKRDREGRLSKEEQEEQERWYQEDLQWAKENPEMFMKAYETFVLKKKR
ncbi:hypothetical protein OWM07_03210 [Deferribacter thermophilus]|uniref:hypothetical protein n=1 Tax=Deferribacter thermophilus TaxID=53573 RepID=UPI003C22C327